MAGADPQHTITIEGHADERGREGQDRLRASLRHLQLRQRHRAARRNRARRRAGLQRRAVAQGNVAVDGPAPSEASRPRWRPRARGDMLFVKRIGGRPWRAAFGLPGKSLHGGAEHLHHRAGRSARTRDVRLRRYRQGGAAMLARALLAMVALEIAICCRGSPLQSAPSSEDAAADGDQDSPPLPTRTPAAIPTRTGRHGDGTYGTEQRAQELDPQRHRQARGGDREWAQETLRERTAPFADRAAAGLARQRLGDLDRGTPHEGHCRCSICSRPAQRTRRGGIAAGFGAPARPIWAAAWGRSRAGSSDFTSLKARVHPAPDRRERLLVQVAEASRGCGRRSSRRRRW